MSLTKLYKSAIVEFTPEQMFALVNSVEHYPKFLPWCSRSSIVNQTSEFVEASLEISWHGLSKSFTTRNHQYPPNRIDIRLISGPFKTLHGHWRFEKLENNRCNVSLTLEFELIGGFLDRMFQPIFYRVASSLVDAFCNRAKDLYKNSAGKLYKKNN